MIKHLNIPPNTRVSSLKGESLTTFPVKLPKRLLGVHTGSKNTERGKVREEKRMGFGFSPAYQSGSERNMKARKCTGEKKQKDHRAVRLSK